MTSTTVFGEPQPAQTCSQDGRRLIEVLVIGLVGSLMILHWPWEYLQHRIPGHARVFYFARLACTTTGLCAMIMAWLRSRKLVGRRLLTLVVWSVPFLYGPPLMSGDARAYAAQGWVLAHGLDPYTIPQGVAGALGVAVDQRWRDTTAVYPPGSLWIQATVVKLAHADPTWSVTLMRIPAIIELVLIMWAVPRLARFAGTNSDDALWLAVCNPLTIINIVAGMHNDGLQVGLSLVALVVAAHLALTGRGWLGLVLGGALVGLAGSIKQPGVLAGIGIVALVHVYAVRHGGKQWSNHNCWSALLARIVVGVIPAVAVFGGISAIHGLGLGWLNSTAGNPASVISDSPIALGIQILRYSCGIPVVRLVRPAVAASLVLTVIAMIWCWARWGPVPPCPVRFHQPPHGYNADNAVAGQIGSPFRLQAGIMIVFVLFGAALQPWYLISPLTLLSVVQLRQAHRNALIGGVVAAVVLTGMQCYLNPFVSLPLVIVGYLIVWKIPKAWAMVTATT